MSLLNTTVLIGVFSSIPLSFQFRDILYGVEGWVQDNLSGIFPGKRSMGMKVYLKMRGTSRHPLGCFRE